jgi:hypothetical protein
MRGAFTARPIQQAAMIIMATIRYGRAVTWWPL